MSSSADTHVAKPLRLCFSIFEMDGHRGELRRDGVVVHLPRQPFKVLWLLASRAGDVLTREEISHELWGVDTYVDFDGSLNFCIAQIRKALRDSAESPRFIQTLPRRGYRFLVPVVAGPISDRAPLFVVPLVGLDNPLARGPLPPASPIEAPPSPNRHRPFHCSRGLAIALALALAGAAVVALKYGHPSGLTFTRITYRRGAVTAARFGSDGRIVYSASWDGVPADLFEIRAGGGEPRAFGLDLAEAKGVLPSGDALAVARLPGSGKSSVLVRVPTMAGEPRALREGVADADGIADNLIATVVFKGNDAHVEFPLGHDVYHVRRRITDLRIAPDGSRVAFMEHPAPGDDRGDVVTVDRSGRRTVLAEGWASLQGLAWTRDSQEVWFTGTRVGSDMALYGVSPGGAAREIYASPGRLILHDIAADGRVLIASTTRETKIIASIRGQDREFQLQDASFASGVTRDGSAIAFSESGVAGGEGYGVFFRKTDVTDASPAVRIGQGRAAGISPDGQWVLTIPLSGAPRLVVLPTGALDPRTLGEGLISHAWPSWFPDSRRIAFLAAEPGRRLRLYVQDLGGARPRPITAEGMAARRTLVSPDGMRVLCRVEGSGPWVQCPVAGGEPIPMAALEPSDRPITWNTDGSAIIVAVSSSPIGLFRVTLADHRREHLRTLGDRGQATRVGTPFVTPDEQTVVYTVDTHQSDLFTATGLR